MDKIKYSDIQNLAEAELQEELQQAELHMVKMRFDHAVNGNVPAVDIQHTRQNIARFKTEMRNRELATMTPEQIAKRSRIRHRRSKN